MTFSDTKMDLLESNNFADIYKGLSFNFYDLKEESLNKQEGEFARFLKGVITGRNSFSGLDDFSLGDEFKSEFRNKIISVVEINRLLEIMPPREIYVELLEALIRLVSKVSFISNTQLFSELVIQNSIGLKQIGFFMLDRDLEEIMVNDIDSIFVFHKKYGYCKTNLFISRKKLSILIERIARSVGKTFNSKNPILDAHLSDGSRVNATFSSISPKGVTLTIRKFTNLDYSIVDMIKDKGITSEAAAFLWMCVDGNDLAPRNLIVSGATATGKTTFLNILSTFIRLNKRVVTIEDTSELSLPIKNIVSLEARSVSGEIVSIDELLKNSLRMRPDRIIVGEVRGEEALTLFTAMDNGHDGCLGTIHSNNSKDLINKLKNKPFSIPPSLISLVNLIVVMKKFAIGDRVVRKVVQISEVSRMDKTVLNTDLFNLENSELKRTDVPSHLLENLADDLSMSKNEIKKEIHKRQSVLEWMVEKDLSKKEEVLEVIQSYYFNPQKIIEMISG